MELTQLKQFQAVAEKNSISAAAEELHISQPALSCAVKKLESELGLPLFRHSGNKIQLNEAGRLALKYANAILLQSRQMETELKEYANKNSHIRLGFCDPGPMWYCVPQLSVMDRQLDYGYYTMPPREEALLYDDKYDIIISSGKLDSTGIISKPFIRERKYLSVDASHPLSAEKAISARDPRIQSLFLFTVNGFFHQKQQPFWESVKKQTAITTTTDYFLFSQMLKNPEIITTTTEIVKHYRNDGPGRVLIPLTDRELEIHYHISYPQVKEHRLEKVILLLTQCAENI